MDADVKHEGNWERLGAYLSRTQLDWNVIIIIYKGLIKSGLASSSG